MKKTILLFSLILIAQASYAFIDTQYTTDEKFLVNTGYSKEAAKIIDITAENPYREPAERTKNIPRLIYHYIVPGQGGDIDFYNHSGNFDGWSWMDY